MFKKNAQNSEPKKGMLIKKTSLKRMPAKQVSKKRQKKSCSRNAPKIEKKTKRHAQKEKE